MLYRLFPFSPSAAPRREGGPLFAPRLLQGDGRHDNPATYAAFYTSRNPESVVAELLRSFRTRELVPQHLHSEGRPYAIVHLDDSEVPALLDLDDPANLVARSLRPSRVATRDRSLTRTMALSLYQEGLSGFEWWSTIEASWINVTLFAERALDELLVAGEPDLLTIDHPSVRRAAEVVGILLG